MASATYPSPRINRTGAGGAANVLPPPGSTVPRVRSWAFELHSNNSDPHCVVSDRMQGMAVLTDLHVMFASASAGGGYHFNFVIGSSDSGARNGGADVSMPEGNSIFDNRKFSDPNDINAESLQMLAMDGAQTYAGHWELPVRTPIVIPEFFLKVYYRGVGGVNGGCQGWARVVTGLSEDEIANFL